VSSGAAPSTGRSVSSTTAANLQPRAAFNAVHMLRLVFSFPVTLACLLLPLTVLTLRSRFSDPDMWWHLKMGETIWTTHHIPTVDLFSYTARHHTWIPHEWLSQLTIYAAYRAGGYSGLMAWLCIFSAILLVLGYVLCSIVSGNSKVAFLGALVIWLFATVGFSVRPQMIGYVLLIVELLLLHLGRARNPRWFWALPPLFAFWVNCHGSFIIGIVIAVISYTLSFIGFHAGSLTSVKWDPGRRMYLAWSLAFSLAAFFLNPVGTRQILYPIDTMLHQPIGLSQVQEWQPLQVTDPRAVLLLLLLLCIFLLVLVRRSEVELPELVFLALGAWMALSHQRMLFVFGILAAPFLSRMLSDLWEVYDADHDRPLLNAGFIFFSFLVAVWAVPGQSALATQVEESSPVKAVTFLKIHHVSGRMLNDYVYGGYLIWEAPEYPVFIDGRADVFEWSGVLDSFGKWATLESDPRELLERYGIDFCLISRDSPMARVLPLIGWRPIYSDKLSVIFTRPRAEATTPRKSIETTRH
jgi:hypothetical protein